MSDLEFTGERVVPGLVETNLFNEHFARYRFAAHFAKGRNVLDAGCGTGYGAAELAQTASSVTAMDFSVDALTHAAQHFPGPAHITGRCETFPFADNSFDLITAFEVIEHLANWPALLSEAARTLRPTGIFAVSTPNKSYYAETREASGPNPYHEHEFEFEEFETALRAVFPHVQLWLQNHTEAITLAPVAAGSGVLETASSGKPDEAHFYVALCSDSPLPAARPFAWVPEAANVLRTREHHIALLKGEVEQKSKWLSSFETRHAVLQAEHEAVLAELQTVNGWADGLAKDLHAAKAWGAGLEATLAEARAIVAARDAELAQRDQWIASLRSELETKKQEVLDWQSANARLETELRETHERAETALKQLHAELQDVHQGYQTRLATLESEAAQTAGNYAAEVLRLETEIAGLHAGYQDKLNSLDAERVSISRAYEEVVAGLQSEMSQVHAGYQGVIDELTDTASSLKTDRDSALAHNAALTAERDRLAGILTAAAASKWLRLGRKLNAGPDLEAR